ncbi:MAG: diaminopimelate decarboxylase [Candidatus Omnitrophota bacterium]
MTEFKYKKNSFCCEGVDIAEAAQHIGTPFYLYSHSMFLEHYKRIKNAFSEFRPLICFSMKSNSNLSILKILTKEGAGLDIVSGGELYKALKVGADPKKIVYASVGKTESEIKQAVAAGILFFNIESLPELELINKVAGNLKKKVMVAIRLNPDITPGTHSYITTSKKENKFGLDFETARLIFKQKDRFKNLFIEGLHVHIGSQITKAEPFKRALSKVITFINELRREKFEINYLNIGGGLGIVYSKEKPQSAERFAKSITPLLRKAGARIILEPGRFISGNSGVLVTKVIYVKKTQQKVFVIVDAGMNDLLRPSLYGAYHAVVPQQEISETFDKPVDVVGPICESGDFLAKDRHKFPQVKEGDLLVVLSAGAYGFSMASNYNSRPRIAEALVKANAFHVIRKRETYKDLISKEIILKDI